MPYHENPKTKGSGIACCIPQEGTCPQNCSDCFFQSGRSYLEPLAENLPNMPTQAFEHMIIRVNDGNDSNNWRGKVIADTRCYKQRFFNTSVVPLDFPAPVVLTLNPGLRTDDDFIKIMLPPLNMMFGRVRVTTWNLDIVNEAVEWYTSRGVPIVLTFMAFFDTADQIPSIYRANYQSRKRTLNTYHAITHAAWSKIMYEFETNPLVHSCGTEGVPGGSMCKNCGNCVREYHATIARMRGRD